MGSALALPTPDSIRFQMHRMAQEAVDEIAPRHLNKKGRMAWVARELGAGFDRVRKAYHRSVKCIEHHEFIAWEERFARLLAKGEQHLVERLEHHRTKLDQWQASRAPGAQCVVAHAAGAGNASGLGGYGRRSAGGLGQGQACRAPERD